MPDLRKYSEFVKKNKYLLAVLIVGIILLLLPTGAKGESENYKSEKLEFEIENIEKKLEKILVDCDGVGRVRVALATSGTPKAIYAEELVVDTQKNDAEYTKAEDRKLSILSSNSGEQPITIQQMYPDFLGATIVCDGADNSGVQIAITGAVASLTGLSTDKITIIKMKK